MERRGKLLAQIVRAKTDDIKDLQERSAKLISVNNDLIKYVKERDRDHKKRPLDIVCYFEEYHTYIDTRIGPKKDIGKIVSKPSAAPYQELSTVPFLKIIPLYASLPPILSADTRVSPVSWRSGSAHLKQRSQAMRKIRYVHMVANTWKVN